MRARRWLMCGVWVASAALTPACLDFSAPGEVLLFEFEDETPDAGVGVTCANAIDCPLGQLCIDGVCADGCVTNADCPPGERCEGLPQLCVPSDGCVTSADCVDPAAPVCHPTLLECVACAQSLDCPGDLVCTVDPACENNLRACQPSDYTCTGCTSNIDCIGGGVCDAGSGRCVECLTDVDCASGQVCDAARGFCTQCVKDDDCAAFTFRTACLITEDGGECVGCVDDADCAEGTCDRVTLTCAGCLADSDCDDPTLACNPATGLCFDTSCALASPVPLIELDVAGMLAVGVFAGPPVAAPLVDDDRDGVPSPGDRAELLLPLAPATPAEASMRVRTLDDASVWSASGVSGATRGIAVGDLDGAGRPEVVALRGDRLVAHDVFGSTLWTSSSRTGALPALFDVDQDGFAEIVAGGSLFSEVGARVWLGEAHQGAPEGMGTSPLGLAAPLRADAPGLEVVAGGTVYSARGETLCSEGADGYTAVAELDGDASAPELVVASAGPSLRVLSADCALIWGPIDLLADDPGVGPPAVGDLDGDGVSEVVVVAGGQRLVAVSADGFIRWAVPLSGAHPSATPALADLDADGLPEVLVSDAEGLHVVRGDGFRLTQHPAGASRLPLNLPLVVDADADDAAEILVAAQLPEGDRLVIFQDVRDRWPRTRNLWNQHAYIPAAITDALAVPVALPAWWRDRDATRAQPTFGTDTPAPNLRLRRLVASEDLSACPDRYSVTVAVGNRGQVPVAPGAVLEARFTQVDTGPILRRQLTRALDPGQEDVITLVFDDLNGPVDLNLTVARPGEDEALTPECSLDDNALVLEAVGCPPFAGEGDGSVTP